MSTQAEATNGTSDDKSYQLLLQSLRSLPSHALNHLHSLNICIACILRSFAISLNPCFSALLLSSVISEEFNLELNSKHDSTHPCLICLGILQFSYNRDNGLVIRNQCVQEFIEWIVEFVRREGHQFDCFALEVSLPQIVVEREQAVWLYVQKKYGSESWFEQNITQYMSAKDALKFALTNPLETLLGRQSGSSSYRIRLTYTEKKLPGIAANTMGNNHDCKRRKTGEGNASEISSHHLEDQLPSELKNILEDQVYECCNLALGCYRSPIYFGGRYLKFARNVSQTRWIIDDERMGEASVEEIIGDNILPICRGDSYKFHAAGREDIDVRMLGSGRPFLVEVQNARQIPSEYLVKEIEAKINESKNKLVGVKNLKLVTNNGWALMHEGEAEKLKQYCALVWISRPLEDKDSKHVASLKDLKIVQRTPIRVLHRRSPLEREKIIHWMEIERLSETSQYFLLHLCTQAGTYIKEFVHGDMGRTHPSIGSLFGCRAEILQLDVTEVKMDCFLDEKDF